MSCDGHFNGAYSNIVTIAHTWVHPDWEWTLMERNLPGRPTITYMAWLACDKPYIRFSTYMESRVKYVVKVFSMPHIDEIQ